MYFLPTLWSTAAIRLLVLCPSPCRYCQIRAGEHLFQFMLPERHINKPKDRNNIMRPRDKRTSCWQAVVLWSGSLSSCRTDASCWLVWCSRVQLAGWMWFSVHWCLPSNRICHQVLGQTTYSEPGWAHLCECAYFCKKHNHVYETLMPYLYPALQVTSIKL